MSHSDRRVLSCANSNCAERRNARYSECSNGYVWRTNSSDIRASHEISAFSHLHLHKVINMLMDRICERGTTVDGLAFVIRA